MCQKGRDVGARRLRYRNESAALTLICHRLAQFAREREKYAFVRRRYRLDVHFKAHCKSVHNFLDENFRRRGAGRNSERGNIVEQIPFDVLGAQDETGELASRAFGDFLQSLRIRRIGRADDEQGIDEPAPPASRPPAGWSSRSKYPRDAVQRYWETAGSGLRPSRACRRSRASSG